MCEKYGTVQILMTRGQDRDSMSNDASKDTKQKVEESPGWTDSLKQLYDSVVDEPIPDSFKDLLSQLDKKS